MVLLMALTSLFYFISPTSLCPSFRLQHVDEQIRNEFYNVLYINISWDITILVNLLKPNTYNTYHQF